MLVKHDYICDNLKFECYIFITENNGKLTFWFVGKDVAEFLNYKDTRAIYELPAKYRITWMELRYSGQPGCIVQPDNWQDQSVFISEAGLYALIFHSKKSQFTHFFEWICEYVLPSLRESGKEREWKKRNDDLQDALIGSNKDLQFAMQHNVKLTNRIVDMSKDVVSKPQTSDLLQCVVISEYLDSEDGKRWYRFTIRQEKWTRAIADLLEKHPGIQEIFRSDYTPNGIYSFICLKKYLTECGIKYDAIYRRIHFSGNDISSEQLICIFKKVCCLNRIYETLI